MFAEFSQNLSNKSSPQISQGERGISEWTSALTLNSLPTPVSLLISLSPGPFPLYNQPTQIQNDFIIAIPILELKHVTLIRKNFKALYKIVS